MLWGIFARFACLFINLLCLLTCAQTLITYSSKNLRNVFLQSKWMFAVFVRRCLCLVRPFSLLLWHTSLFDNVSGLISYRDSCSASYISESDVKHVQEPWVGLALSMMCHWPVCLLSSDTSNRTPPLLLFLRGMHLGESARPISTTTLPYPTCPKTPPPLSNPSVALTLSVRQTDRQSGT